MARWRDGALAAAATLEVAAAVAASRGGDALALALHAASCAAVALGLDRRLLEGAAGAALAFTLALFVPVLGPAGLAVAERMTRRFTPAAEGRLVRTRVPGLAEAPAAPRPLGPRRGVPALTRIGAARGRSDPGAVEVLRGALAHPEEDVRLIAFSVLEAKSRAAYRGVHDATRELEVAPAGRLGAAHRDVAARHWEIARLGLAEGECLAHALHQARHHVLAALKQDPGRASLHLLLGRIELRRGQAREAEAALTEAVERGLPPEIAQPYLAEAAFLDGRFDLVRRRLAGVPARAAPAVDRVRRYWS